MRKIIFVTLLCWFWVIGYAQNEKKENREVRILTYIMPDSLELMPELNCGAILQQASVKSKRLNTALMLSNAKMVAKAFPTWNEKDSITYLTDGKRIKKPELHRVFALTFASEEEADTAIKKLNQIPAVLYAEKEAIYRDFNDPRYIDGTQWHLNNNGRNWGTVGADINAEGAWYIFQGSPDIKIGIVDRGMELTHDEFLGKATGDIPTVNNHGTNVAGVAAAIANNGTGGRGVDWNARILAYNRVSSSGTPLEAQQITKAVNDGAHVINCSWGSPDYNSTVAVAVAYANKMNRVTVVSMGNDGNQTVNYPAALSSVIAVGATDNNDNLASFSNTGNHIDVVAPGVDIYTTTANNGYETVDGTSFSAPQVSGLASLLRGYRRNLDNEDIRQIIRLSADDRGNPGFDPQYGYGRINAGRAMSFLNEPYLLVQSTATGGTVVNISGQYKALMISASGLSTNNYLVKRIEVQKTVTLPNTLYNIMGVWGRGVSTTGWSAANPNFGEGFCEVVQGSQSGSNVTLRTYVYQVYNILGQYLGYYPASPSNVTFAYSVLGLKTPIISGPSTVCDQATYTLDNLPPGATVQWSVSNSNLTLISGQGTSMAVFKKTNNGETRLFAKIILDNVIICDNLSSAAIQVGTLPPPPYINAINGTIYGNQYEGGQVYTFGCPYLYHNTSFEYFWNEWGILDIISDRTKRFVDILMGDSPAGSPFSISLQLYNECGYSPAVYLHGVIVSNKTSFSLTPNPATTTVAIYFEEENNKGVTKNIQSFNKTSIGTYQIQLWSSLGLVKTVQTDQPEYQLDLSGVAPGFYYVHVIKDGQTYRKQLMVK